MPVESIHDAYDLAATSNGLGGAVDPMSSTEYALTLTALIVLTVADTVLCTVNLYYYTDTYAQYFNQGTGAVYIVVSVPIVLYNRWKKNRRIAQREQSQLQGLLPGSKRGGGGGDADGERPGPPLWILIAIGALNGTGNFFNAIGSPHTRANTQSLLQLLGLPIVLLLSWLWLGKRPSGVAAGGALLIVLGTVASAAPTLAPSLFPCGGTLMPPCAAPPSGGSASGGGDDGGGGASFQQEWYSVLIYFGSTLFYSTEKVFEESTFHKFSIDIFYMFFWTLVTQVMLGWVYYPIQIIPAFGGLELSQIPSVIWDGALCTIGMVPDHRPECLGNEDDCPDAAECAFKIPLLFFVYCAVDYSCYAMGLYVIQRGGANLMVLTTAISVPLQQMAFALHFVLPGNLYQPIVYTDGVALVLCLAGFFVYHHYSREGLGMDSSSKRGSEQ